MPKKRTKKKTIKPKGPNKREIVFKFVENPQVKSKAFWMKEFSILKKLEKMYPLEFWAEIDLGGKKFESLAILTSPNFKRMLDRKNYALNYKKPEIEEEKISDTKFGEDHKPKHKKQTLREKLT